MNINILFLFLKVLILILDNLKLIFKTPKYFLLTSSTARLWGFLDGMNTFPMGMI